MDATEMNKALEDIAAERQRQIDKEGWSTANDDQHTDGSLSKAAAAYATFASCLPGLRSYAARERFKYSGLEDIIRWPESWAKFWWKPTTRRRDLVKAGALIIAEIERLDRLKGDQP